MISHRIYNTIFRAGIGKRLGQRRRDRNAGRMVQKLPAGGWTWGVVTRGDEGCVCGEGEKGSVLEQKGWWSPEPVEVPLSGEKGPALEQGWTRLHEWSLRAPSFSALFTPPLLGTSVK